MFYLWILPIFFITTLVGAKQCQQSETCMELGGQCFRGKQAPEGAEVLSAQCKGKKCKCYKLKETETPSTYIPENCFIPEVEHVGNDLVLPPLKANSSEECHQMCADFPGCKYFSYFSIEDGDCKTALSKNITGNETVRGNCYLKNETNATHNNCSVSGSLTCLSGETPSKGQRSIWQNDWDGPLLFQCPSGYSISRIRSEHSNHHEDRRWRFDCRFTFTPNRCQWSGYVNNWDHRMLYVCPSAGVIAGVNSYHDNRREDRRWQYICCSHTNRCYSHCSFTDYINWWDSYMDYIVPTGYTVAGFESEHDNGREDRRWRVMLCRSKTC